MTCGTFHQASLQLYDLSIQTASLREALEDTVVEDHSISPHRRPMVQDSEIKGVDVHAA